MFLMSKIFGMIGLLGKWFMNCGLLIVMFLILIVELLLLILMILLIRRKG